MPSDDLIGLVLALRGELASYRELPLVPSSEHTRVIQQRDAYAEQLDAMTRHVSEESQARVMRLLDLWQDELRDSAKEWHTEARKDRHNAVRALLAEAGMRAPEQDVRAEQYAQWEAGR